MIDIRRRGFLFGATAAALVVAAPKSFFIVKPPKLVTPGMHVRVTFDLPLQQMMDLKQKLLDEVLDISAIPRWVVVDPAQYDMLVGSKLRGRVSYTDKEK